MQHPRRCKDYHRSGLVNERAIKAFDVLEIKHVTLNECLLDLLTGPRDEQLVVVVGLLRQAQREIDGIVELHSFPISLQENAELLSSAQGKYWDQDFATFVQTIVDFFNEVSFTTAL